MPLAGSMVSSDVRISFLSLFPVAPSFCLLSLLCQLHSQASSPVSGRLELSLQAESPYCQPPPLTTGKGQTSLNKRLILPEEGIKKDEQK